MFNEYVIHHTPPTIPAPTTDKNVYCLEKMTQTSDSGIWQVIYHIISRRISWHTNRKRAHSRSAYHNPSKPWQRFSTTIQTFA